MKASEIRKMSIEDMNKKIQELKVELFNLRFQSAAGNIENTARLRNIKKDIARLKTEIRSQEISNTK